jgi:hypothetical protein
MMWAYITVHEKISKCVSEILGTFFIFKFFFQSCAFSIQNWYSIFIHQLLIFHFGSEYCTHLLQVTFIQNNPCFSQ